MDSTVIKTLLDSQEKAYRSAMEIVVNQLNSQIKNMEDRVSEVTRSLEFTQSEMDGLKQEVKNLQENKRKDEANIRSIKQQNENLVTQVKGLEERCNYQEDYSRRNNLRLSGVMERPGGETWEQTVVLVRTLFSQQLQLSGVNIERAHRTGKPSPQGHRTIVVRFATFADRELVMRSTNKLSGTKIFINEDLCPASQAILRSQLPQLKKAKSEGKVAFFRHTTLVIKEKTTTTTRDSPSTNNSSTTATIPTTSSTVPTISPTASTTSTPTTSTPTTSTTVVASTATINTSTIVSAAPTTHTVTSATLNSTMIYSSSTNTSTTTTIADVPPSPLPMVTRPSSSTTNTDPQPRPTTPARTTSTAHDSQTEQGHKLVQSGNKKSDSATPKGQGAIKKSLRKKN